MEHAPALSAPFPWRTTTVVAGALALLELIALVAILLVHIGSGVASSRTQADPAVHARPVVRATPAPRLRSVPLRPRAKVRVLVLNGNGITGAASTAAARLEARGYRVGDATDAQRHDYASSMVMFVPGWAKEARRLARDVGVRMVGPVDGLRGPQLKGSKVVLLLGR